MKNSSIPRTIIFVFCCLFFLLHLNAFAQVGIGTTTPNTNALLDIDAAATIGGLLLPRVALTRTNLAAPLGAKVAGMTVYNTNATIGTNSVTPGYYYNDGVDWIRLASSDQAESNWSLTGNSGTTPGIGPNQNYLGTIDNKNLLLATWGASRFEITSGNAANRGRLRSFDLGSALQPTYSWNTDPNTGMYSPGADLLGFSTGGSERVRVASNGNVSIGTSANATQKLEVQGNLRLNGAFMPNNQAGGTDKILLSQGGGTAPVWGPGFLNTSEIKNIGKYYVFPVNSNNNEYLTLTVTDANMTKDTSIVYNFLGNLPVGPMYGYDLTLTAESRNGQLIFHVVNFSGYDLSNMQIVYTAFYH